MGYRNIYIKKCYKLCLKNNSLYILKDEDSNESIIVPLEDISTILIEDPKVVITARLITEMSKYGITCFLCNEKYMPNTQILPINSHYNLLGVYNKQINQSKEAKELLWQKIVKAKIQNQILVETFTRNDKKIIEMLKKYYNEVEINDKSNREGIASKVYFTSLFGNDFIRFSKSPISNALDYGYMIIHGTIVRYLTLYGFNTYLGIWHCSEQNMHNLASDFIEPFRPLIDYLCFWKIDTLEFPLSSKNRKDLINILNTKVLIDGKKCSMDYAIETTVKSYLKVLQRKNVNDILLPIIESVSFIDEEFI